MSAMTNHFEREMLNTMRNTTAIAPASVHLALFLSDPTESGTAGTEVSYAGYARQPVTFAAPATSGVVVSMENATEIEFPKPNGAAGRVTHGAIMSAATGGDMLLYVQLTNPIELTADTVPRFIPGEVMLTMSGTMMDPGFKARVLNYLRGSTINGFHPFYALFDGDPLSGGTELMGTGYARLPLEFDQPVEQISGQMMITNLNATQTQPATTSWGTWAFMVVMDAETGGGRVWSKQNLGGAYTMNNNAQVYLRPGNVRLSMN